MYNYVGGAVDYEYGNPDNCYDCRDGYYLNPTKNWANPGTITTAATHAGTCKPCGENIVNCLGPLVGSLTLENYQVRCA